MQEQEVQEGRAGHTRRRSLIASYLDDLHRRHAALDEGEVAAYIPELATADPSLFGICLTTVDGAVYEAGDTRTPFTVQSMSKPLTYGLALELLGWDAVRRRIGVEPSGDAFNEVSLVPGTGTPVNPMINAGAIACAGLVASETEDPWEAVLDAYARYAGRRMEMDEAVYRSESETGHRNRAIAHLLRNFDVIEETADDAVDLYFRQCSVLVDCRDLAAIAGTLANGGINPLTGERAVDEGVVRNVLSVMTSCGMYDWAGEWLVEVGLPAKSGVSGGVLALLPGRLGIGVFSPPLDAQGNSVRGIAVCRDISRDLALHLVRPGERQAPPVRASYTLAGRPSKRVRNEAERRAIRSSASSVAVFELQGDLGFSAGEALARDLDGREEPADLVLLDLRRVLRADAGGLRMLNALADQLNQGGGRLVLASDRALEQDEVGDRHPGVVLRFANMDLALEWSEDELLRRLGHSPAATEVPLDEHQLLAGLTAGELDEIAPELGLVTAEPGSLLVRRGEAASEIFLVTRGMLSVVAVGDGAADRRLTTLSAGMTFGELAYVSRGARLADVRADSDVECRTLPYAVIDAYRDTNPGLHSKLLSNLLGVVVSSLEVMTAEVGQLVR
ncbi:MAG TPA: glutaminase A [Gaiellaceae bacterium]|nr:glutaminase A [Gaiellaceae bacterium]